MAPSESSTKRKRRGARGTKQTRMKGTNVNEHCLAACAEAQRTVADENAKSLLEEWQQFDDSQAVVDSVLAEFADEIGSNDEPEEILELDDVIEQPAASMSGVKVAAARAIHSVKTVTSSEIESMPWAKVKPLLAAMHAWSHMVVRSVRNVQDWWVNITSLKKTC